VLRGGKAYWLWLILLVALIAWGGLAYADQLRNGLIVTNMRDQVSLGLLHRELHVPGGRRRRGGRPRHPAYIYHWGPIKEVAILGEILAISAIVMCLLFVVVDMGRPDRFWHLIPASAA